MECNKALQAMLVLGIVMFIIAASAIFTTNYLQKENAQLKEDYIEMVNERAKCSSLGFCIGDRVEPTDHAKKQNISFADAIVKAVRGSTVFIDMGNEDWRQIDEAWVKHNTSFPFTIIIPLPQLKCSAPFEYAQIIETARDQIKVYYTGDCVDKNTIKKEPEYRWETLPTPNHTPIKHQTRWIEGEGEPAPEEYQYYENYYKRSEEKVYQCEKLEGTNKSESDRCWFIGWR